MTIDLRAMPASGGIVATAGDIRSMDAIEQRGDPQGCFTPEELAGFVAGRLPKAELDAIAAHIKCCLMCAALVDAARGRGFPPELLSPHVEDQFDKEPEAEELTSKALAFRPSDELAGLSQDSRLNHLGDFYVGDRVGSGPHGTPNAEARYPSQLRGRWVRGSGSHENQRTVAPGIAVVRAHSGSNPNRFASLAATSVDSSPPIDTAPHR